MRIFLDTNVLLDALTKREPFCISALEIWSRVEKGEFSGYVSAASFNNIFYVSRKLSGRSAAAMGLKLLRDVFHIVPLDEQIIHSALDSDFTDFEDAIQFFSAHHVGAEVIVTRNARDFTDQAIPAVTPEEFLNSQSA
jgi:predicted nucleic acid-binding protein